jgi:uncharacterized membrane protein
MNATRDKLVDNYLARLDDALGGLPRRRRREIVEEISRHIAEAEAGLAPDDEASVRDLLDRLGDPEEIAAEARGGERETARGRGWQETLAIVLLLVGGFIAGIGWFVGVVLLWLSSVWTTRDKLIGTFVLPFGLGFPFLFFWFGLNTLGSSGPKTTQTSGTDTGGTSVVVWIAVAVVAVAAFVLPIVTAVYLARRSRRLTVAAI